MDNEPQNVGDENEPTPNETQPVESNNKAEEKNSVKTVLIAILVILALAVAGGAIYIATQEVEPVEQGTLPFPDDDDDAEETAEEDSSEDSDVFDFTAELEDVTNGETLQGTEFDGNSSGEAQARFANGEYKVVATFENLPDPAGDAFYEGWIVNQSEGSVLSTGELEKVDGVYTNTYTSDEDLTDHTFYVLTIEPNDDDPMPADHVVEGTLTKN